MDDAASLQHQARLKRFQRFGEEGPVYEVLGEGRAPRTVAVRVIESGEEFDYRVDRALADPEA